MARVHIADTLPTYQRTVHLHSQAVLTPSEAMPEDAETVCGWDFERGRDLDGLLDSMLRTGFQATAFGRAVNEVNRMVRWPYTGMHHVLSTP